MDSVIVAWTWHALLLFSELFIILESLFLANHNASIFDGLYAQFSFPFLFKSFDLVNHVLDGVLVSVLFFVGDHLL